MAKKPIITLLLSMLLANAFAQGLSYSRVYDNFVQFFISAPSTVDVGDEFNVVVTFIQTTNTSPFNRNGDMDKVPAFPQIDGLARMGEPRVFSSKEESKNGQTVTGKTYSDRFTYKMLADKAGTYRLGNVRIRFRGKTLTADPVTVTVRGATKPAASSATMALDNLLDNELDLLLPEEDGDGGSPATGARPATGSTPAVSAKPVAPQPEVADEPIVYDSPYVRQKTAPRASITSIKAYKDRTEVNVSYTSRGENVYSSSECYIQDTNTKEHVKMRILRGDVGYDKKYFAAGTRLQYTMVFPPIKDTWRNVDIIENVSGGFRFLGVGLAAKPRAADASLRGQIASVDWSGARKVVLNSYRSDFLFTDGLLPVYNKELYKWGFYDEKGDKVIDFVWDYDDFEYPHFGGGYCIVSKVRKVNGFYHTDYFSINRSGQPVKLSSVEKVTPFCDGIAAVVKKGGRYVYIRGNGQELSPRLAQYIGSREPKPVRPFVNGLSAYYDYAKGKYGFINKNGGIVISPRYDEAHDFSEGLAAVKVPATASSPAAWGFIDVTGRMVIPAQYSREPSSFSQGRAVVVKRNGDEVMIDKAGSVVSPEFQYLFPFFSTGYTLGKLKGQSGMYVLDGNYGVVTGPLYGVEGKHRRYDEHHGAFQTPVFGPGYTDAYAYLTTGENLFRLGLWKQTGVMSENLIHVKDSEGDFFMDYNGRVAFRFVQSEF